MIWLTWRQFRAQAAMMAAALAALAVILAVTGPGLADDYSSGIAACQGGDCSDFLQDFFAANRDAFLAVTAAVLSEATTVEEVIAEIAVTRMTERGATRGDDKVSDAAMEDRKKEGYF